MAEQTQEKEAVVAAKPGYKKTKLGWIPEEWEEVRLKEKSEIKRGAGSQYLEYIQNPADGVRLIRITDFLGNDPKYVKMTGDIERFLLEKDDLLIAGTGATAGISFEVPDDFVGLAFSYNVPRIRVKKSTDKTFILYCLRSNHVLRQQHALFTGNAQPFLDTKAIGGFRIPLPPLPEQRAIAAVLATWDRSIDLTHRLIETKKARQKGLMQQLLSGKKRLDGFEGEWEQLKISAIADEVRLLNKDNEDFTVLSCTKYDGLVRSLEYFGRRVYSDDLSKYKQVPPNCFAYATNHIEEGSIGFQNVLDEPGLVSPMYTVFETDNELVDDEFLFKLLKSHRMIFEYNRNMSGSINRRGGLRWKDFSSIRIKLPKKSEQRAIAAVLSRGEAEINQSEQYLSVLQQQKKGLMQKLLTGEVRVKKLSHES